MASEDMMTYKEKLNELLTKLNTLESNECYQKLSELQNEKKIKKNILAYSCEDPKFIEIKNYINFLSERLKPINIEFEKISHEIYKVINKDK